MSVASGWEGTLIESWRKRYLRIEAIPVTLTEAEIEFFFRLDHSGLRLVARRRRPMTRLGLVLHIAFLRMSGRHLPALDRVPSSVLAYTAGQVGVTAPQLATLRAIYRRRPTLFEHQHLAALATGKARDRTPRARAARMNHQH